MLIANRPSPNPAPGAMTLPGRPPGQSAVGPIPDTGQRARRQFSALQTWLLSPQTRRLPLHHVECAQEPQGRELQRLLLEAHLQQRGNGDVGPAFRVRQAAGERLYTHRRIRERCLKTVFGPVRIARLGYSRLGAPSIHPLDQALQLPARSFSYELQKRMVKAAVQGPFEEAAERIQEITGVRTPKRSVEQVILDAAHDFDAFYVQRTLAPWKQTGPILVAAVDGKGIPIVKQEGAQRVVRAGKGQKANRKRMATVATVFTRTRWVRTPEEVVESLFRTGPRSRKQDEVRPRPEHKRVWASLVKGKAAVFAEVAEEMERRDPEGNKIRVALTDGERALQRLVKEKLGVTLILDLLHVLEKLWKAAYLFHAEGSLEAEQWVRQRALRILQGEVSQVVKGLRQTATKRKLRGDKRKNLDKVASYLYRNRDRMRYQQYLAQGLPIASGPVEGACKNLIKDRMERSGMRWTERMAEAIVKLRAIYLSRDLDSYWCFHIDKDQERLHPPGLWIVVAK